jgi:oligopeptide/dipeptide ABC transporter ATP-binding protein
MKERAMDKPVLEMKNVRVDYRVEEGIVHAVRGATYSLLENETLALVGESGCGKSQSSYAAIGLIQPPGEASGEILFRPDAGGESVNLLGYSRNSPEIRRLRGGKISMIFQEPMSSLSPVHRVGRQIDEVLELHEDHGSRAGRALAAWLGRVVGLAAGLLAGILGGLAGGGAIGLLLRGVLRVLNMLREALGAAPWAGQSWLWDVQAWMWAAGGVLTPLLAILGCGWGRRLAQRKARRQRRRRAVELLAKVGIPDADRRYDQHSFEFSGGMRQRIMIAMALAGNPRVLFADEPTTGLDVTIQAQILELIHSLQKQNRMSTVLITHDLAVVAERADRVAIMYMGRLVELADVYTLFASPRHPYTVALMRSVIGSPLTADGRLATIRGTAPGPLEEVPGCPFHPRCDRFMPGVCDRVVPEFKPVDEHTQAACHLYDGAPRGM